MRSRSFEIRLYATRAGEVPFSAWLDKMRDKRSRQLVEARLLRLADGNFGDCKSIGRGVFELRIFHGAGLRVYFGKIGEQVVILLSGGDKASQERDIKKAQEYWRDFKVRTRE